MSDNEQHVAAIPATPMHRRIAAGHLLRTGHELTGYLTSEDGSIWKLVRTCECGESPDNEPAPPPTPLRRPDVGGWPAMPGTRHNPEPVDGWLD